MSEANETDPTGGAGASAALHSERLSSLELLITGLANAVNSPLASLLLNLGALRTEIDDVQTHLPAQRAEDLATLLDELTEGAHRIEQLVSGLQHHTLLGSHPAGPVSVRALVERAQQLSGVHRTPQATVKIEVPDSLTTVGREGQLVQVLVNLMRNAQQACEASGEPLLLEVYGEQTDEGVSLRLQDGGPGMPASVLERATEPFFSTRLEGDGTGFGLYICEAIVRAHGGELRLDSQPGRGTVAHLRLPAFRA